MEFKYLSWGNAVGNYRKIVSVHTFAKADLGELFTQTIV